MSPVNGLRPSPLKINKDSHVIQKSSSSSLHEHHQHQHKHKHKHHDDNDHDHNRQPIIIYTHSPQTIHTNPKDFMALVQKLTGCSTSAPAATTTTTTTMTKTTTTSNHTNKTLAGGRGRDRDGGGNLDYYQSNQDQKKQHNLDSEEKFEGMMAEIPLFTPNSTNLLLSQKVMKNPKEEDDDDDQMAWLSLSPGITGSLSPSFMEFINMKELP